MVLGEEEGGQPRCGPLPLQDQLQAGTVSAQECIHWCSEYNWRQLGKSRRLGEYGNEVKGVGNHLLILRHKQTPNWTWMPSIWMVPYTLTKYFHWHLIWSLHNKHGRNEVNRTQRKIYEITTIIWENQSRALVNSKDPPWSKTTNDETRSGVWLQSIVHSVWLLLLQW